MPRAVTPLEARPGWAVGVFRQMLDPEFDRWVTCVPILRDVSGDYTRFESYEVTFDGKPTGDTLTKLVERWIDARAATVG